MFFLLLFSICFPITNMLPCSPRLVYIAKSSPAALPGPQNQPIAIQVVLGSANRGARIVQSLSEDSWVLAMKSRSTITHDSALPLICGRQLGLPLVGWRGLATITRDLQCSMCLVVMGLLIGIVMHQPIVSVFLMSSAQFFKYFILVEFS